MVTFALAITVLLLLTSLLISTGMFLAERRGLQSAADAAALAGARRLADEQASRSFRDVVVQERIAELLLQNRRDPSHYAVDAVYLDGAGVSLGPVGTGGRFPESAVGVRVAISAPSGALLIPIPGAPAFVPEVEADAGMAPAAAPRVWVDPAPLALPLAAFAAGPQVDLYDVDIPEREGLGGYFPFLDLASSSNSGAGYLPATDFGDLHLSLQLWSDGLHSSGSLGVGALVAIAESGDRADVRAGLLDRVIGEGLVDADGLGYVLIVVPIWSRFVPSPEPGVPTLLEIDGFAQIKLLASDIDDGNLRGYAVPYFPGTGATAAGPSWGPSRVLLTR